MDASMLVTELPAAPEPHTRPRMEPATFVCPEQFDAFVGMEAQRHARYLRGFGVLRIGPARGRRGAEALRDALETETRRTDSVCPYPDGSAAVLVREADREAIENLANRLRFVAREISTDRDSTSPAFVVGIAAASDRRLTAEEIWSAADEAMARAREHEPERMRWHS